MIAAAEAPAAIFDQPQPAPIGPVFARQLLQRDDAMGNAVNGLVRGFARQIVEQQDSRTPAREIMLQREDLAAVAERTLRKQPDFGQAVDRQPLRLHLLECLEYALGRLTEFEIGGVEQALLLILVQ